MFAADATAKAAAAQPAKPSFTEQLVASTTAALDHILALDPWEVAINAGLSAAVVLLAFGLLWIVRRLSDHWLARVNVGGAEAEAARTQQAARLTWGLLRLAVATGVLVVVLGIWGVDARAWFSGEAGARLVR